MNPSRDRSPLTPSQQDCRLVRVARAPGIRVLAWRGDQLYGARGYALVRAQVNDHAFLKWEPVAEFHPELKRRLAAGTRIAARLFRAGFHALAVLPSGRLTAAVAGAIVSLRPGENQFRVAHRINRGTRPLHVTAVPSGGLFWGEYFDNPARDEVHVYASSDGESWSVAYTFPKGAIRHVHNIVYDGWQNCLWILTGDYGSECRILRADCDFGHIETVLQGNQQARAVAMVPMQDGLYFASDTPLEANFIYRLARNGNLSPIAEISSSSIYGCQVAEQVFFSTMVEPSRINRDRHVRIYASQAGSQPWQPVLKWQKDFWPMGLFQYGNAILPDGSNTTPYLALTTVAVNRDDSVMSIFRLDSDAS